MAEFVIITGLSGAGRSEAAKHFEDLGWYVIDNLPPSLMPDIATLAREPDSRMSSVALVVGSGDYGPEVQAGLASLRDDPQLATRTLFLLARTPVLVRRYETTRRSHPFRRDAGSLADAIEAERLALEPIAAGADVVIDTSDLNVHQLRARIIELFGGDEAEGRLRTRVSSFGYKHGIPVDVDLVIDCRFLPNPHWVEELRELTGSDQPVKDYVMAQPITAGFLQHLRELLATLMPAYAAEGKAYLTIAFGCTGGRHRSVVIAEETSRMLAELGFPALVTHRDVEHPT